MARPKGSRIFNRPRARKRIITNFMKMFSGIGKPSWERRTKHFKS